MEACRYKWYIEYGARNLKLELEKKSWVKTNSSQSSIFLAGHNVVPLERERERERERESKASVYFAGTAPLTGGL